MQLTSVQFKRLIFYVFCELIYCWCVSLSDFINFHVFCQSPLFDDTWLLVIQSLMVEGSVLD